MKVLCIDNVWTYSDGKTPLPPPYPIFGEIYTVINYKKEEDGEWYYLEGMNDGWETCGFAPISDIDETEMERNYIKDKV